MANIRPMNSLTVHDLDEASSRKQRVQDKTSQHHIEYGTIEEVDNATCRVKVRKLDGTLLKAPVSSGQGEEDKFPLLTPLTEIHFRYGQLREGLKVRIHWIGQERPEAKVYVEVINDNQSILSQDFALPDLERGFGALP